MGFLVWLLRLTREEFPSLCHTVISGISALRLFRRCERSEPRRMRGPAGGRRPSRRAFRAPQDDGVGFEFAASFQTCRFVLATRCPSFARIIRPKRRGRRECRGLAAPAVSCANVREDGAHEHTGTVGAARHSLRSGFTAYAALSLETNSFCLH